MAHRLQTGIGAIRTSLLASTSFALLVALLVALVVGSGCANRLTRHPSNTEHAETDQTVNGHPGMVGFDIEMWPEFFERVVDVLDLKAPWKAFRKNLKSGIFDKKIAALLTADAIDERALTEKSKHKAARWTARDQSSADRLLKLDGFEDLLPEFQAEFLKLLLIRTRATTNPIEGVDPPLLFARADAPDWAKNIRFTNDSLGSIELKLLAPSSPEVAIQTLWGLLEKMGVQKGDRAKRLAKGEKGWHYHLHYDPGLTMETSLALAAEYRKILTLKLLNINPGLTSVTEDGSAAGLLNTGRKGVTSAIDSLTQKGVMRVHDDGHWEIRVCFGDPEEVLADMRHFTSLSPEKAIIAMRAETEKLYREARPEVHAVLRKNPILDYALYRDLNPDRGQLTHQVAAEFAKLRNEEFSRIDRWTKILLDENLTDFASKTDFFFSIARPDLHDQDLNEDYITRFAELTDAPPRPELGRLLAKRLLAVKPPEDIVHIMRWIGAPESWQLLFSAENLRDPEVREGITQALFNLLGEFEPYNPDHWKNARAEGLRMGLEAYLSSDSNPSAARSVKFRKKIKEVLLAPIDNFPDLEQIRNLIPIYRATGKNLPPAVTRSIWIRFFEDARNLHTESALVRGYALGADLGEWPHGDPAKPFPQGSAALQRIVELRDAYSAGNNPAFRALKRSAPPAQRKKSARKPKLR